MPEAMPNIAPIPEPEKMLPPRPRTKAEKLADMLKRAKEIPPEDVTLLEDEDDDSSEGGAEEIPDNEVELLDAGEEIRSGIHSIPPPPSMRKAEMEARAAKIAELQLERVVEAQTIHLANGMRATFTMEKPEKRADTERSGDAVFVHEDPEIGPMAGAFDGLGGEGNDAIASERLVAVLPIRLMEAYNELRTASQEEILKNVESLSIITRDPETGALAHAKNATQKRATLFTNLYPEIARKAITISKALQAAHADIVASGGKTTASFSVIHTEEDGGIFAITANIGDSGTLVRRANGEIEMATIEDSALDEFIEAGLINPELLKQMRAEPNKEFTLLEIPATYARIIKNEKLVAQLKKAEVLTPEILQSMREAPEKTFILKMRKTYKYLKRANTQTLGGSEVSPRISVTELEAGDSIIALTDGYLDFLEHEGELDLEAVKGALKEKEPEVRMNRLREITSLLARMQRQEGEALKEPDDMAAVELSV